MKNSTRKSFHLMVTFAFAGFFSTVSIVSRIGWSATDDSSVKKVLKNGNHTAEVQINRNKVIVRLNRGPEGTKDKNPRSVMVSFYDQHGKETILELKALATPEVPEEKDLYTTNYTGAFAEPGAPAARSTSSSESQQSFVGMELRIPLPQGKNEVFSSKPIEQR